MKTFFLTLLLCGSVFAQSPAVFQPSTQQTELSESIITRLNLSKEVAWTKFQNHLPVADLKREAAILTVLKSEGRKIGLTGNEVSVLFIPQIAASRREQEELIAAWRFGSPRPSTQAKDLQREIRPLVTKVSLKMLRQWNELPAQALSPAFQSETEKRISQKGFSPEVAKIAASPLGK